MTAPAPVKPAPAPSEVWTIQKVLAWTTSHFDKRGIDAPRLTAEILLAFTLGVDRVRLYIDLARPLHADELSRYRGLIHRRVAGEPTQYLTAAKEFYGRAFHVDPRVLIPRPETELLVESVLRALPADVPARALDLCTGTGCIAVTLAAERPRLSVWATDLSQDACEVARENAEHHQVGSRVTVLFGDLDAPLPPDARFDLVVSNPPYIASGEIEGLAAEVRREPRLALDGGEDGLALIRRVVLGARERLRPGGLLAMEIGETQGPAVRALLEAAGYEGVRIEKDLELRERMAFGTRPERPR